MMKLNKILLLCFSIAAMAGAARAIPTDFDFSGNFTYDNDVVVIGFTVDAPSQVTVFSSSWLQGNPPHGFDPMLGIWDGAGNLITFQDDGNFEGSMLSGGIWYNHGQWDSYYSVSLGAGSYFATVTQYDNFNAGGNLADGFLHDGNPNFTYDQGFGGAPYFNGTWDGDDSRTGAWQFHLLGVDQAQLVCGVSPSILNFGTVTVGAVIDTSFTITNAGVGTLSGSVTETCAHYSIVSGGGPYSLTAGQHVTVTVRFEPSATGTHECTIETGGASCTGVSCTGVGGEIDAVGDELASGPTSFRFAPDTQNPLRPGSGIAYELPVSCHVRLDVYTAQGRRLATLIDSDRQSGRQTVRWDGRGSDGREAPSGVCFFRLQAGSFVTIKRMVLLR